MYRLPEVNQRASTKATKPRGLPTAQSTEYVVATGHSDNVSSHSCLSNASSLQDLGVKVYRFSQKKRSGIKGYTNKYFRVERH